MAVGVKSILLAVISFAQLGTSNSEELNPLLKLMTIIQTNCNTVIIQSFHNRWITIEHECIEIFQNRSVRPKRVPHPIILTFIILLINLGYFEFAMHWN